jgi:hypothetical protein
MDPDLPAINEDPQHCFFHTNRKQFFSPQLFLMEQKSLLFIFSSAASQRIAYSEMPSQMAAHLRTTVTVG